MDAVTTPPAPTNEPNLTYAPGTPERDALRVEIEKLERRPKTLRGYVGGRWKAGGGPEFEVVQPHDHQHVLGVAKGSTQADAQAAVKAAAGAAADWRNLPMDERCAILLKAADLLAGPWRQRINAATMLGQCLREALDELLDTVSGVRPRAPRGRRKSTAAKAAAKKKATKG